MSALPARKYSLEEYLELDRHTEARLEYWDGEIFDMSGVSENHAQIEVNITIHLGARLAQQGCRLFPANMRIRVPSMPPYRYGDLSALCGAAQFVKVDGVDVLVNPALIIEILSSSTEAYDRGDKFTNYKSIPAFSEYLLVAQHRPHVSQFIRQPDNSWLQREYNDLSDVFTLTSVSCELALTEVYQRVIFNQPSSTISPAAPQSQG
jgi:Uma2 family endonuclease